MGVDWRALGWKEYQMTLAGWNAQHAEDRTAGTGHDDFSRLRRAMKAHSIH